jgi:ATP-dependent helicase/nuclease subunit A
MDVLDAFLGLALDYERSAVPTLEGFLARLEVTTAEIKREADTDPTAVRVMTVHGAKGLEAPIVFLVDSCGVPVANTHLKTILTLRPPSPNQPPPPLVWTPRKTHRPRVVQAAVDAATAEQTAEYQRLLYVGMTRAKDRLIVCGYFKKRPPDEACWYRSVETALCEGCETVADADGTVVTRRWRVPAHPAPPAEAADGPAAGQGSADGRPVGGDAEAPVERPGWLHEPVSSSHSTLPPLRPSAGLGLAPRDPLRRQPPPAVAAGGAQAPGQAASAEGEGAVSTLPVAEAPALAGAAAEKAGAAAAGGAAAARDAAAAGRAAAAGGAGVGEIAAVDRGTAVHELLDRLAGLAGLAGLPAERRAAAAEQLAARLLPDAGPAARAAIVAEALAVLAAPGLAHLFGPDSRGEIAVAGRVLDRAGRPREVAGRIDRLVVEAGRVLLVDFKTDRAPPATPAEVSPVYRDQLAIYRALIAPLFPGRTVVCGFVWTVGPRWMPLAENELPVVRLAAAAAAAGAERPATASPAPATLAAADGGHGRSP